ncbi:DUF3054 domain-containing protein [Janibacter cremeus]|uniref:DUF3054 domain-containing protein n=1 Tax=Janibacter cremeus TaxID=1285192 RepID=A0A852VRZ4_9MICO|nr:DUF3054 domain-containing protein [Janibacter cremeus]NYF96615.1 hypothetical protein [Janibacter cremeus]
MTPPGPALRSPGTRTVVALGIDVVIIAVFTLLGRRTHDEALDPAGWWHTAWPFLVGLVLGWALVVVIRRTWPLRWVDGVPVWLATLVTGMLLRAASGQGTAAPFVVVATLFLAATLIGWRLVAGRLART